MEDNNRKTVSILLMALLLKRRQSLQMHIEMETEQNIFLKYELITRFTNESIPKITTYHSHVISLLNSGMFRMHFRMTRNTFNILLQYLEPHWQVLFQTHHHGGLQQLSLEKNLLIALWTLATPDSYRSVAERFGVGKSTVYSSVQRTVYLVNTFLCNFIKWPEEGNDRETNANKFESKCGVPQIIGSIDGCHIPIKKPTEHPNDYFNRKKFHSLVLQGICDADLRFIDVDCRWPGSVHDARVFRTSPIYERGSTLCQPDYFIIGDAAYPCKGWILSPYKDNGFLTQQQKYFNEKISKTRVVIENCFALLKGRFRRLKYLEMSSIEDLTQTIICCCILHNICLDESEDIDMFIQEGLGLNDALHEADDYIHPIELQEEGDFRGVISNYLWDRRRV